MMTTERHVKDLFDLTDKVVLITGAGGYLGSAMCRAFVEAGATVVASSRQAERARQIATSLGEIGGQHFGVELDHMDSGSIDQGFDEAVSLAVKSSIADRLRWRPAKREPTGGSPADQQVAVPASGKCDRTPR